MPPLSPKSRNLHGTDIILDYNAFLGTTANHRLVAEKDLEGWAKKIAEPKGIHDGFSNWHAENKLEFVKHIYDVETATRIKTLAAEVRHQFEHVVVLGIGGSVLPAKALVHALTSPFFNTGSKKDRQGAPQMFFCDNIDPIYFHSLLAQLDPTKTLFSVVSKSGATLETMGLFLIARDWLARHMDAKKVNDHFIVTTDPHQGDLRALCNELDLEGLALPPGIGGRFSALTAVGLFPAAVAGIDIDAVLAGAHAMDQRCQRRNLWENPAYMGSVLLHLFETQLQRDQIVFFSYGNALEDFNAWLAQLIGESLGKGGKGLTPVLARGATDQHSLLQLFLDGPDNKIFFLLHAQQVAHPMPIPAMPEAFQKYSCFSGFSDQSLASLLDVERRAVEIALQVKGRPVATLHCPRLEPQVMGQCLFLFQIQTAFSGFLRDINPFDQPAVELGKKVAYHFIGRTPLNENNELLKATQPKDKRFIF